MATTTVTQKIGDPPASFRLFHLPQEMQDLIYEIYFEGSLLQVEFGSILVDRSQVKTVISGIPSLDLKQVCQKMSRDSLAVRNRIVPRVACLRMFAGAASQILTTAEEQKCCN